MNGPHVPNLEPESFIEIKIPFELLVAMVNTAVVFRGNGGMKSLSMVVRKSA